MSASSSVSTPLVSRKKSVDFSSHTFSSRDKLEKYAQVFTGSHALNNFYGSVLSKTLKFRHAKGYTTEKFNANEIITNLYVGDVYAAHNSAELKKRGFTHIVNCVPGVKPAFTEDFKYLYIPLLDCATENISELFNQAFEFIHEALSNHGRVLIHCLQGMSRSATIASAYVMKALHVPAREAVSILQSKRGIVKPNYGFMIQLEQFEKEMVEERKEEQEIQEEAAVAAGKNVLSVVPRRSSI